jgi:hypothetical protein
VSPGILCLPVGLGVSPKRDLSGFFNLADVGLFVKAAAALGALGVAFLLAAQVAKRWER